MLLISKCFLPSTPDDHPELLSRSYQSVNNPLPFLGQARSVLHCSVTVRWFSREATTTYPLIEKNVATIFLATFHMIKSPQGRWNGWPAHHFGVILINTGSIASHIVSCTHFEISAASFANIQRPASVWTSIKLCGTQQAETSPGGGRTIGAPYELVFRPSSVSPLKFVAFIHISPNMTGTFRIDDSTKNELGVAMYSKQLTGKLLRRVINLQFFYSPMSVTSSVFINTLRAWSLEK